MDDKILRSLTHTFGKIFNGVDYYPQCHMFTIIFIMEIHHSSLKKKYFFLHLLKTFNQSKITILFLFHKTDS